jgi:ketosteroid isomerase-like protein
MSTEQLIRTTNEQTVRDFLSLLSQKDLDTWLKLWTEDAVQDMPFSPPEFPSRLEGRKAIAKHYSSLPQAVGKMDFLDLKLYPLQDPDWILAEYRGEIEVLSTGRPYNNHYCGLFQLRNGKIALFREYYNPLTLREGFGDGLTNSFSLEK